MTCTTGWRSRPQRAERGAARKALGLPADAFVVAVLGRISGWKGQDVAHPRAGRSSTDCAAR